MRKIKKTIKKLLVLIILGITVVSSVPALSIESKNETDINEILAGMTQKEKFGQLLMVDFRNWTVEGGQLPVTEINKDIEQIIRDYKLGGVILFRENIAKTEQTTRLTNGMQKSVSNGIPLLIGVDQEGGLVTRLQTGTNMPGNMALGATRDAHLTQEVAKAIGEEIRSLGININFAPSVDVNSNYKNPVIGIRSFGSEPSLVSEMGVAYIKGLQDAKVAGAAKHFPGHGDTSTDSHFDLPLVEKSLEEFHKLDLKPFLSAVDAGVEILMTAHIVVPSLDDTEIKTKDGNKMGTPATLSRKILTGLVRDEMDFQGIVITDALNMKAISDNFTESEIVVMTIAAGADIALMPTSILQLKDTDKLDEIYKELDLAVKKGIISQKQIDKSVYRVLALKKKLEIFKSDDNSTIDEKVENAIKTVGSTFHKEIERKAAEKAITIIKNDDSMLPFELVDYNSVLILSSYDKRANLMELQLNTIIEKNRINGVDVKQYIFDPLISLNSEDKKEINNADFVIIESMNLKEESKFVPEAVTYANESNKKIVVMSTRNPYDIMFMQDVKANIAVYGSSGYDQTQEGQASLPINIPVGMDVIFGEVRPSGLLPVSIPKLDEEGNIYEFGHGLYYKDSSGINPEKDTEEVNTEKKDSSILLIVAMFFMALGSVLVRIKKK